MKISLTLSNSFVKTDPLNKIEKLNLFAQPFFIGNFRTKQAFAGQAYQTESYLIIPPALAIYYYDGIKAAINKKESLKSFGCFSPNDEEIINFTRADLGKMLNSIVKFTVKQGSQAGLQKNGYLILPKGFIAYFKNDKFFTITK